VAAAAGAGAAFYWDPVAVMASGDDSPSDTEEVEKWKANILKKDFCGQGKNLHKPCLLSSSRQRLDNLQCWRAIENYEASARGGAPYKYIMKIRNDLLLTNGKGTVPRAAGCKTSFVGRASYRAQEVVRHQLW
jgi:hypothetical protein